MSAQQGWQEALDAFEARLLAVREAMASGDLNAVEPFTPDEGLGPMPESLAPRAQQLLAASRELERVIEQAQTAVRARLRQRPAAAAPRRASRLDVSV